MSTSNEHGVEVGQIWADNDWRCKGRTVEVTAIDGLHAFVKVVTDSTAFPPERPRVGKVSRIRLDRFRPTSTGYRLTTTPPASTPGASA